MRRLGPAWVELHGTEWRKRRGLCPDGALVPNAAAEVMRKTIDAHESTLAERATRGRDTTFAELAGAWHEHGSTVGDWKPSYTRDSASALSRHLLPAFGGRPAAAITESEVRSWWRNLHDAKREGGALSNRNANKQLALLRAIFNWGIGERLVHTTPAGGVKKHREASGDKAPFYSREEVQALVRAAGSERDGAIFLLAAFTGLRRGEIVSLRWRDVDFARRTIHTLENVSAGKDARVKDDEGRTVPLATEVAMRLARRQPREAHDGDLVFPGSLPGRKLDGDALSERFRAARDRAGLRPLRFHDLRHTFGSLAVDGGASLVQVQAWMGHSDIKTTMRYLHTKNRAADADLLDGAFDSTSEYRRSPVK